MAQLNSTVVTPNISSSPGYPPHLSLDASRLIPAVVLSICFLLGFPGNIAVIILKPNWENMSSLSQSLMLSLAVSDLLCLVTLPLWIYSFVNGWIFGLVSCKLITYFVYCSVYASLLTVTALSVQRYLQVVHLQRCLHQVKARMLLVPLWLVAMILSIPELVVRQLVEDQQWTYCEPQYSSKTQKMAILLTETLVGSVSLSVIVFSYISIYRKVNRTAFFNNPQTTRLITSITVIFAVHWVPYLVINMLGVAAIPVENDGLLKFCEDSWDTVGALTFVNSAVNPLLYAFTSNYLSSVCQNISEIFTQKIIIPPNLSKSADITTEVTFK
ncbi:leukotriene B4 receptor 1-like [Archocentrus centrarchus]|uniref:leukotriene B4 receptor 1-like n=1 Tax=Archocentrus centrarchus TaxID=63155 RepID=UPI0011E9FA7F|nr:leukotriene B4 receptor 1-like [Archocentrus centrarchus]